MEAYCAAATHALAQYAKAEPAPASLQVFRLQQQLREAQARRDASEALASRTQQRDAYRARVFQ
jgi:hypothetical protein